MPPTIILTTRRAALEPELEVDGLLLQPESPSGTAAAATAATMLRLFILCDSFHGAGGIPADWWGTGKLRWLVLRSETVDAT
jgi:hypothetical protein